MQAHTRGIALLGLLGTTVAHAAPPPPPGRGGFGPGGVPGEHRDDHHDDPYEDCGASDIADLDIRGWSLDRELASEDNVMTVFRLHNDGPCPARNVRVTSGGGDWFSDFRFTCPDIASQDGLGRCVLPTLAPGETKYFTLTATVCAFVTGESRDAFTYVNLEADSTDPDAPAGFTTYEFAYAHVHLIGPYDDDACRP